MKQTTPVTITVPTIWTPTETFVVIFFSFLVCYSSGISALPPLSKGVHLSSFNQIHVPFKPSDTPRESRRERARVLIPTRLRRISRTSRLANFVCPVKEQFDYAARSARNFSSHIAETNKRNMEARVHIDFARDYSGRVRVGKLKRATTGRRSSDDKRVQLSTIGDIKISGND